jgi:hypothetical protein
LFIAFFLFFVILHQYFSFIFSLSLSFSVGVLFGCCSLFSFPFVYWVDLFPHNITKSTHPEQYGWLSSAAVVSNTATWQREEEWESIRSSQKGREREKDKQINK